MSNKQPIKTGRPVFSAVDMLRQARGLPTPQGYAVITKEFAESLESEMIRLYELEEKLAPADPEKVVKALDIAIKVYQEIKNAGSITAVHPLVEEFETLLNLT